VLAVGSSFNCLSTAVRGDSKWQYYCALSTCRNVAPHMYWTDRTISYWYVNLAIFVQGMKYLKNAFLCRTESLICRMPTLFGSPSLLIVMASFTGNSEEETVFEDTTDEPYKTTEFNFKYLLCWKYSTVNHVITTCVSIVQDRTLHVSFAVVNFV
jgi:hypothetical protein